MAAKSTLLSLMQVAAKARSPPFGAIECTAANVLIGLESSHSLLFEQTSGFGNFCKITARPAPDTLILIQQFFDRHHIAPFAIELGMADMSADDAEAQ